MPGPRAAVHLADRHDAGRRLAARLRHLRGADAVVLGLPRGGVPVAFEVARELGAPLDVIGVRKLGVPGQPELAMGAVGEGGVRVLDGHLRDRAGVGDAELAALVAGERAELERRTRRYRAGTGPLPVTGRTAVVVDDGIATGATARAACRVARARGAGRVVLAVPVAPRGWTRAVGPAADETACLATPHPFGAVGRWYDDFAQVEDATVVDLLARARGSAPAGGRCDGHHPGSAGSGA